MEMDIMQSVLIFAGVISVTVTALVELIKLTVDGMPKKYLPMVSFVVGLVIGAISYPFTDMELVLRLWAGAYAGLAGTGLFEVIKKTGSKE